MLLNRINPYLFRALIIKVVLSLKPLEIPNIQPIRTGWSIRFMLKKTRDAFLTISNYNTICRVINNTNIDIPETQHSYIITQVPETIRFFTNIILVNKVIIKKELIIQINIILAKMHCCPNVKPDIIYIINFIKKIRLFIFLVFRLYLEGSDPGKKKVI